MALTCAWLKNTSVVLRFHWAAALHALPEKKAQGRRSPAALKGKRQRSPKQWVGRSDAQWEETQIEW